jgi:hypothetical protein
MNEIRYHSVQPLNLRPDGYTDFDNIDFQVACQGRKILGNSVRILGNITVYPTQTATNLDENIYYDGLTGSHSWFQSITTSFQTVGQVENIQFYPNKVASKSRAQLANEDLFQSMYQCENRNPNGELNNILLKGTTANDAEAYVAGLNRPLDFAIKPDFCLNNFVAGTDSALPYAKTGDINIQLIVSRSVSVLYGGTSSGAGMIGVDRNIRLTNVRLIFTSIPDDAKYAKEYSMVITSSLKQSLQSSYATISANAPLALCDRFWIVFVRQSDDTNPLANGLMTYRPPYVERVEYLYNDSFNGEFQYALLNEEEILTNFVRAVNNVVADTQTNLNKLASNDGYGLGARLGGFVDFRTNKLSINIQSGISSSSAVTAYMFFSGIVSI